MIVGAGNSLKPRRIANVIANPNGFTIAPWAGTRTTPTENSDADPDGGMRAGLIANTATSGTHSLQANLTLANGWTRFSIRAKAGTLHSIILLAVDAVSIRVKYNLQTGIAALVAGSPISFSIVDIGGGWFWCSLVFDRTVATVVGVRLLDLSDAESYLGTTAENVLLYRGEVTQ